MSILVTIIFIGLITWVIVDCKRLIDETKRCPKCKQIIREKINWKHDNPFGNEGPHVNVTIYKCSNCGFSWNLTSEYSENSV